MPNSLQLKKLQPISQSYVPVSLRGLRGATGTKGKDGISLPAEHGINGKNGLNGLQGEQGTPGTAGKNGRKGERGESGNVLLDQIAAFKWGNSLQWLELHLKDGSKHVVEGIPPTGKEDDPFWLLGGDSAGGITVKDIIAGKDIEVDVNKGIYTIKLSSIKARRTIYWDTSIVECDRMITVDASDRTIDIDLSGQEIEGRQLDVFCIDASFAVTILGTVNGDVDPAMAKYDSYRIVYNSDALIWELR